MLCQIFTIPYSENILLIIKADYTAILTLYKDFSETSKLLQEFLSKTTEQTKK